MSESLSDTVERQRQFIAGGTMSLNRAINPSKLFVRAKGAYLYDVHGREYIDYHAGFAPYLFGHGDAEVDEAVIGAIRSGASLIGAGTMPWEAEIAELLVECVPGLEQLQLTSTGSEAVGYALRLARAHTGRDVVVVMQGGYNGCLDYVSYNLMDPASFVEPHVVGEDYPLSVMSAGVPKVIDQVVRAIEYNDLEAAERTLARGDVAAIILEPILQNIGIVKPLPGYLEGLRALCDKYDTVLIFDEVKTGFRHALGGYQALSGVIPDLCTFGKAVANGYPMGVVGGKRGIMKLCSDPSPSKRVAVAGTYNGHPVNVAAAKACLTRLKTREKEVYSELERLGARLEAGLKQVFSAREYPTTIVRQGSAFTVYFMDHVPVGWRDIAMNHNAGRDIAFRRALIEEGVFLFPVITKQGSISLAHRDADIDRTIAIAGRVVEKLD
ncbi:MULTISPECIES: aspartate aminotransferase family protein [unclassified Mesorhizobium]|uniref:aspartate aminotransferase family protein n=1 Tax=unclassified Mesorhizobium TaxID=325217 RepID=UPI000FD9B3E3|nr:MULTISPECIES: aspartate aminotransferase family protein [unclassified Mesorhizobium]TGT71943.1 aspartate aminotransferase family protein [Mesorhizobium sp. M2E.F.Ca.ET.166.01.1.1]TGV99342.1 aspartate aminotransferase family protein [Mesorhizobium sp. M2E.F.Ca.ET.154.01.1.1]